MQNFWESDRSKTFSSMLEDLKKVSYFEGLGSCTINLKELKNIRFYLKRNKCK